MSTPKIKNESYALLGGQNSKVSPYGQGPHEFRRLVNLNFTTPNALTKRPGSSLYTGATLSGQITGGCEFERLSGASYIVVTANTNAYQATPNAYTAFKTGLKNNALFDFVTFVDRLFGCNGHDFFKYDGTNSTAYSLPPGLTASWGVTTTANGGAIMPPGTYVAAYGYMNDRGYIGPPSNGITIALSSTGCLTYVGLTTPAGYGISAIQLFRSSATSADLFGTTQIASNATGATDIGWPLVDDQPARDYRWFTLAPRFLEIFNNQLFLAGFSGFPSTAHWSDIGEPEGVLPEYNAEFRTNDGDRITGMKSYNGVLVVGKERSLHRVVGDNPTNFAIQEITDQCGWLSDRAVVVFDDLCWGLDPKGIVEYNGAGTRIVSTAVEDIFRRMNVNAARDQAVAIHRREDNEVWFGIPIDGATYNNCTVIYDYIAKAWSTYDGFSPALLMTARGALGNKTTFYGGYTGNLFYFSPSLMSDYGRAITCMMGTHFLASEGQTSEAMYRRYWMNLDPVGVTQAVEARFKKNYEETYALTRTMYQAPFQSRVDFGISARSIAAEILHVSASLPFKVYGFTFESRHLRDT